MDVLPDVTQRVEHRNPLLDFEMLMAALREAQREVVIMLKIRGLTLDETARATSSTVGAVKQKAHRAYEKLRIILASRTEDVPGGDNDLP